jgi:hypothetical protein
MYGTCSKILLSLLFVLIALSALGSLFASGARARDQCDPSTFVVRCGERSGTRLACVRVHRDDYLLGVGREHFELATVTCPGGAPLCVEHADGRGVCRAK